MVETSKASRTRVTIRVELFGQARLLADRRQVEISLPELADAVDVVHVLAEACPELVGQVVREDRAGLQDSYTFNHNGTAFVGDEKLHLTGGDSLLLFSSQAGG